MSDSPGPRSLPPISGAMIQIQPLGGGNLYVAGAPYSEGTVLTMQPDPGDQQATFIVSMFQPAPDGQSAKVSFQQGNTYWMAGQTGGGLANPVVLGPNADTFILTPGDDDYSFALQTSFSPPAAGPTFFSAS